MLNAVLEFLELKESVDQDKSEAIIKLTTLLYQADGKVKMQEQELFEQILADLPWNHPVQSKEAFHLDQVSKSLAALQQNTVEAYLEGIVPALKSDGMALTMLRELAVSDGTLDPKEAEILMAVSRLMV